jgi:hypothetical protein
MIRLPGTYDKELVHLEKLCDNYDIKTVWITYKDSNREQQLLEIPPTIDIIARLHVWIAYNVKTQDYEISKNLINKKNHWISTLIDDIAHKRIDLKDFLYDSKDRPTS